MARRDPYTAPGAIYVPSDYAPAPSVPPGTTLGNVQEMARKMAPFNRVCVHLAAHPDELRAEVQALIDRWNPDFPLSRPGTDKEI